jgi:hypothetical protein
MGGREGAKGGGTMGEMVVCWVRQSGGVALLNHRLQAGTPAGVRVWVGALSGGVARSSLNHRLQAGIPMGCLWCRKCGGAAYWVGGTLHANGFDAHIASVSFGLFDEVSRAVLASGMARAIA